MIPERFGARSRTATKRRGVLTMRFNRAAHRDLCPNGQKTQSILLWRATTCRHTRKREPSAFVGMNGRNQMTKMNTGVHNSRASKGTKRALGRRRSKQIMLALAVAAVQLPLSRAANATIYTWNGSATGTWDITGTNWNPSSSTAWDNSTDGASSVADFATASLNATVNGTVYANGITFATAGTLSGGTITLVGTTPTITDTASGNTINSVLAGRPGSPSRAPALSRSQEIILNRASSRSTGRRASLFTLPTRAEPPFQEMFRLARPRATRRSSCGWRRQSVCIQFCSQFCRDRC